MQLVDMVYIGFFGVMIFSSVLWLLVYFVHREDVYTDPTTGALPGVTFIVPAYNEEETITETLDALFELDYPADKLDIIAVNDGSTDGTLDRLQAYKDKVTIIDKENGGKASALNAGLEQVKTELVACMDADSFPEPSLLHHLVGYFEDHEVKGVSPALKVVNPETWVQKIIWMEYVFQIFLRKMFAVFDAQYVLPGPGSVYRTEFVREIGGWDEDTLTEDMEIAFRIFEEGGRIENSTNAYVDTVSPPTLRSLFRQRIRWYRGYLENAWDYRYLFFNPDHGNLGMFLLPFNVVWTLLLLFFVGHAGYRLIDGLVQRVETYLLVGWQAPVVNISFMSLSMFHIFSVFFMLIGVGTMLLSLKTADERISLWERKTHYATFMFLYPTIFAFFWIAAFTEELLGGKKQW